MSKKRILIMLAILLPLWVAAQKLDVEGDARIRTITNDNTLDSILVSDGNGVIHYRDVSSLPDSTGGWTEIIDSVSTLKRVGVGTPSPAASLDVNGMSWFRNNPGGYLPAFADKGLKISTESNVGSIFAYDYAADTALNMSLQKEGGRLGIGTENPEQKLHVHGKVKITEMDKVNNADSVVVRLADGTLGVRDVATLAMPGTDPGQMLYWDGNAWVIIPPGISGAGGVEAQVLHFCSGVPSWDPCPLEIGSLYQGGLIFYLDHTGQHGLIASLTDFADQLWGCNDLSVTTSTAIETGVSNTAGTYQSLNNQINGINSEHGQEIQSITQAFNFTEAARANEFYMAMSNLNKQFIDLIDQYNIDVDAYQIAFAVWTFNGQVGPPPVVPIYPTLPIFIPGPPPIFPDAPNPCPAGLGVFGVLQTGTWFLPSKDELNLMYTNLHLMGLGSFSPNNYWSSSQFSTSNASMQNFATGIQGNADKSTTQKVRLVKTF